uniref:Sulfatase N-terminal domain-containing protein n=1 Tax=Mola mola TaxID=94237 RepID=A0A3Q3W937_MOLML
NVMMILLFCENMRSTLALLLLLLLDCYLVSPQENRKPNFVLMMVDDLGIGDLGCYGNTTLRTPNIDQLAQEGVKLTEFCKCFVISKIYFPSLCFITGIVGDTRLGVFLFNAASGGLPSHEVTFAKIAQQQGYETALIGKWHLGLNCERRDDHCHHPSVHGFKNFFGIPLTNLRDCRPGHGTVFNVQKYFRYGTVGTIVVTAALLHYIGILIISRRLILSLLCVLVVVAGLIAGFIVIFPSLNCVLMRDHSVVEQPYSTENLTQRMTHEAVDFIENSARPFLLFFSFIQVHTAMFASAAFRGTSRHGIYGDAVHEVDWSVGQIMETLERLKLTENTLVYLTSDQGPHLEEISAKGEVHRGWSGIFKAGKSTNWEGGIRVPGILRWPGSIPGGGQIDEPTSNMDLFPTVVQLSGTSVPEDRMIDGHDLMGLLQGRVQRSNHEFLFHYCNKYLNAVRWHPQNMWKVFYFTPNFYPDNQTACFHTHVCFCMPEYVTYHDPPLLFDVTRDPSETTPLTPDTEPAFHSILAVIEEAVEEHKRSVKPVENQLSLGNLLWKPWLQPCLNCWPLVEDGVSAFSA